MAKKKVEKIITKHNFKVEGLLDVDDLDLDVIKIDIEDEGTYDLCKMFKKFSDKYVKITIEETTEEIPEDN